jgi:hypothetical protein
MPWDEDCTMSIRSSLFIRVADITLHITTDSPHMKVQPQGAVKKFIVSARKPDVIIQALLGNLSQRALGKKIFDSGALWQLFQQNGSYLFRFTSPALGPYPYKIASFNKTFTQCEILLNCSSFKPDQPVYPLEYPLDELTVTHFLSMREGVEVHACGVLVPSGESYLFVGQSGAGKTTMARLYQKLNQVKLLSDDRIVLRRKNHGIWMYGTPWHGEAEIASPEKGHLTKIFFLRHGEKNDLVPLRKAEAVARLFTSCFPPFHHQQAIESILAFLNEVVKTIPCYELTFFPNERVVGFIDRLT